MAFILVHIIHRIMGDLVLNQLNACFSLVIENLILISIIYLGKKLELNDSAGE
jgi:hypothetical protein